MKNPMPVLDGAFQPGITDPQWPIEPPEEIAHNHEARERYAIERSGRIDPQEFFTVVTADVLVENRCDLQDMLRNLSVFARVQMTRNPDQNHIPILGNIPKSWRVTITIGFGANIFISPAGDDRFALRHQKPKWLKTMPKVIGDAFNPIDTSTDLIFLIASDHPYVNVSIARALSQGNWGEIGVKETRLVIRSIDQGFSRPDRREFLRFDDGIDNLSNAREGELDKYVYVARNSGEPDWAVNGTYLVRRKIKENLPFWEAFSQSEQEAMIGRAKMSGRPLSRNVMGEGGMTPVYPNPYNRADGELTAHIRKIQPRRPGLDLFDIADLDRRFLRKGYPFFDGLIGNDGVSCGLLFNAFMGDLQKQFEWPVQSWQTNPDFPVIGTGIDALYGRGILTNLSGGYYFCPPASPDGSGSILVDQLFL